MLYWIYHMTQQLVHKSLITLLGIGRRKTETHFGYLWIDFGQTRQVHTRLLSERMCQWSLESAVGPSNHLSCFKYTPVVVVGKFGIFSVSHLRISTFVSISRVCYATNTDNQRKFRGRNFRVTDF